MNVQALVNISIEPKEMRSWEGGFAQITVGQSRFLTTTTTKIRFKHHDGKSFEPFTQTPKVLRIPDDSCKYYRY